MRRSTVSNMIDLMEQKGFLTRQAAPSDARLKRLTLTDRGEELLREVTETTKKFEDEVRKSFAPEDYEKLMRLLGTLCDTLETDPRFTDRKESETT